MSHTKIYLVNFYSDGTNGTKDLRGKNNNQNQTIRNCYSGSVTSIFTWTPKEIHESPLYYAHRKTLDNPRGAGLFLWKPYIILEALHLIPEGGVVLYLDSDLSINANPISFASQATENEFGVAAMTTGFANKHYTKRDCFIIMGCDEPRYYETPQLWAGVLAFQNIPVCRQLVMDWLVTCCNPQVLNDEPSVLGKELFDGVLHRHDQSVLTNICENRGVKLLSNSWNTNFGHPSN